MNEFNEYEKFIRFVSEKYPYLSMADKCFILGYLIAKANSEENKQRKSLAIEDYMLL